MKKIISFSAIFFFALGFAQKELIPKMEIQKIDIPKIYFPEIKIIPFKENNQISYSPIDNMPILETKNFDLYKILVIKPVENMEKILNVIPLKD